MSEPGKSPRQFSNAFKERIVLRLEAGERIAAVAEDAGVRRKLLYEWRAAYWSMRAAGFNRKRGPKPGWKARRAAEGRIAELERLVGRQQADLHFFREALRLWDATSPDGGAPTSTRSSKK
jgi:transposase